MVDHEDLHAAKRTIPLHAFFVAFIFNSTATAAAAAATTTTYRGARRVAAGRWWRAALGSRPSSVRPRVCVCWCVPAMLLISCHPVILRSSDTYVQRASLRGRPKPPATLAQEEKTHQIMRSEQRSMIEFSFFMIQLQTGDLIMPRVPPPCFRRKQVGRHIRFATRAVHLHAVRTYIPKVCRGLIFLFRVTAV